MFRILGYFCIIFVLLLLAISSDADEVHGWSYSKALGNDPSTWGTKYATCKGKKQSPVDIKTTEDASNPVFEFKNFDKTTNKFTLINTGTTAQVRSVSKDIEISGGGLPGKSYRLSQFHFHWGSSDMKGSEHTINGTHYPMEVHMVAVNKGYPEKDVPKEPDGYAVLGVMVQIGEKNAELDHIVHNLKNIMEEGETKEITGLKLTKLLPKDQEAFFRYDGSITTPMCNEAVTWTIFKDHITASKEQMAAFRKLSTSQMDSNNNTILISDNFRPLQPIGGRKIYETMKKGKGEVNSAVNYISSDTCNILLLSVFSAMVTYMVEMI